MCDRPGRKRPLEPLAHHTGAGSEEKDSACCLHVMPMLILGPNTNMAPEDMIVPLSCSFGACQESLETMNL